MNEQTTLQMQYNTFWIEDGKLQWKLCIPSKEVATYIDLQCSCAKNHGHTIQYIHWDLLAMRMTKIITAIIDTRMQYSCVERERKKRSIQESTVALLRILLYYIGNKPCSVGTVAYVSHVLLSFQTSLLHFWWILKGNSVLWQCNVLYICCIHVP